MLIPVAILLLGLASWLSPSTGAIPQKEKSSKEALEKEFLLFGTVFTGQGFALPGCELRVRRAGERKVRWEARSDRRGEFAIRVPVGNEYDMSVLAKGYQEQTRRVDARTGAHKDLVFRLQPATGGKKK